ncbi:MAG: histidinol phosphate phosphatase domain-containing protein, partial [Candidatus Hydrogenedentota bacterium]
MDVIDFHTHTFLSDGDLGPEELIQRATVKGYKAIGITDHCDETTLDCLIEKMLILKKRVNTFNIKVIPGIELTHILPSKIKKFVKRAREKGIPLVIVHGETPVEPVREGTNKEAIIAGADILAHPGHITLEEIKMTIDNNVYLEITARKGHSLFNGYLYKYFQKYNFPVICSSDAHSADDLLTE